MLAIHYSINSVRFAIQYAAEFSKFRVILSYM